MENGTPENKTAKYEVMLDIGSGLVIAKVPLSELREQDINARIMKAEMQKQLTDNIKKRGQLESLPLCAVVGDKIEIISGHHRIRAAKDTGTLKEIYVILDVSGLSRSQIAAKQIAHNAISGFDDQSTLKEIVKLIEDVDDMLESYIGKDILGEPTAELEKLISPSIEFDWKNVTFTFLPHQIKDMDKLIEVLKTQHPDYLGYADESQHKDFVETIAKYQEFGDVKNLGATIYAMIKCTNQMLEDNGYNEDEEYVQLTSIFGGGAIPKESAQVINEAVKKLVDSGSIQPKRKWEAIELWAESYLAGGE